MLARPQRLAAGGTWFARQARSLALGGIVATTVMGWTVAQAIPGFGTSWGVAQSFGAASASTATSLTASTATSTGSGDLLVAAIRARDTSALSTVKGISDSARNVWVKAVTVIQGTQADGEIWYAAHAVGVAGVTVTVTTPAALAMTVLDITGTSATALDRTVALSANSASASTGTTSATTQANEIVVGAIGWNAKVTPSAPAGYAIGTIEQSNASGTASGEQTAWKVVSADGPQGYGVTLSSPAGWTGTMATFAIATSPPPTVTGFSPSAGPDGGTVSITGSGFTSATGVAFNGISQPVFTVNSDTQVTATVPTGATSGPITVTNSGGAGTSSRSFTVQPTITVLNPTSGPIGAAVTISGSGFSGVTGVAFYGGTAATVTTSSDSQISTSVPSGATNGPITVTTAGGTTSSSASFTVTTQPATPHVMVVLLENKGYAATLGSCGAGSPDPYFCSLASAYTSLTSWHALSHPSLPNYLALVSGSTQGCTSDTCKGPYTGPELGGQLTAAAIPIPWAAYMETMPSACYTQGSSGAYVRRHDPFLYFNDVLNNGCANDVLPYPGSSAIAPALTAPGAPDFVWITPDLNDDMHKGTIQQGDAWLQANIAPVLSSPWFTAGNATVIITMDEGLSSDTTNQVPTVIISSNAQGKGNVSAPSGNHYGLLRSIEEAFGLPYLGAAADPTNADISGLFG